MSKKKIGFRLYVLVSLLSEFFFTFSWRMDLLIGAVGVVIYFIITEIFHVKSVDDALEKGAETLEKSDEEGLMKATLAYRERKKQEEQQKAVTPSPSPTPQQSV